MPSLSLQIDPHVVLGIAPGAPLREIRAAYHRKARTYHPDSGGEDWAFRILVRAYEALSTERIARATHPESHRPAADDESDPTPQEDDAPEAAERLVEVERLWIRADAGNPWLFLRGNDDRRFLSCSLNVHWPSTALGAPAHAIRDAESIVARLVQAFREVESHSGAVSSSCDVAESRFYGWLSYRDVGQASQASRRLHDALHARGFRLKQWTRDLTVPRQGR